MRGQESPLSHLPSRRSPRRGAEYRLTVLGAATLVHPRSGRVPVEVLGPGKLLGLVSYLALAPGRRARVDELVDLLWSARDGATGAHDLRQAIWKLRRALGPGAITCARGEVVLKAPLAADWDEFLAALEQGALTQAVALYGGDFLAGTVIHDAVRFDQWAMAEGYRLRRLFTHAADSLARQALTGGRSEEALLLARRVRDADSLEEGAWALLLETLLAVGDPVRAAAEADLFERVLETDGRTAAPETRALLRRARHAAKHGVGNAPATLLTRLVGRERELETLLGAWQATRHGSGRHIHVVGATGLGKSRLLQEVNLRLQAGGERVLYLGARFPVQRVVFGFLSEVVTALAKLPGALGVSPSAAAALVALNPTLSTRYVVQADAARDDEALRHRAQSLSELMAAVSEETPLALLLDDVHWADRASLDALAWALGDLGTTRALCVTAGTAPLRASGPLQVTLELMPLSTQELRKLLNEIAPIREGQSGARLLEWLHRVTGGVPRLVLERLEEEIESGRVQRSAAGWNTKSPNVALLEPAGKPAADLVVRPFTAAPSDAHLAIGITEGLISELSRVTGLRVIGYPSALRLQDIAGDLRALRATLDVRFVVEGAVNIAGEVMEIRAQVREAATGSVVHAETVSGQRDALFSLRARIARAITAALPVPRDLSLATGIDHGSIADIRAYECYLRARQCLLRLEQADLQRAIEILRQGLELSGENALLYATLGTIYWAFVNSGVSPDDAPLRVAEEYCAKASAIDPDLPQGHVLAGCLARARGRVRDQVRHYRRALELDPNNTEALAFLSVAYAMAGKTEAARPLTARLLEVDPFIGLNHISLAAITACEGKFEEALIPHRRAQEIDHSPPTRVMYAIALARAGHLDAAHETFDRLTHDEPEVFATKFGRFVQESLRGHHDSAFALVTPLVEVAARRVEYLSWHMGVGYALLGETQRALAWLEHAVDWGFLSYPFLMSDPLLERIRGTPGFGTLAERVKQVWEAFDL